MVTRRSFLIMLGGLALAACAPVPVATPTSPAPAAAVVTATPTTASTPTIASSPTVAPTATQVAVAATPTKPVITYSMDEVTFSLRAAYNSLTKDIVIPVDPAKLAQVALNTLVDNLHVPDDQRAAALDAKFTNDVDANYKILKDRFTTLFEKYGTGKFNNKVMWVMVQAMVDEIHDAHTYFLNADQVQEFNLSLYAYNNYVGIGTAIRQLDDGRSVIVDVYPDSPAEKGGLKKGDILLKVDGRDVTRGNVDLSKLIRGAENTPVKLTVQRGGATQPVDLTIIRGKIKQPVTASNVLPDKIGYIRIYSFPQPAGLGGQAPLFDQVTAALTEFDKQGLKGLVLDFRGNGGGSENEMIRVASLFTDGDPIAIEKRASGQERALKRDGKPWPTKRPIALLVDEESGSAGEILPLSLQEYKAAYIIGQKTAGALSGPDQVELTDGSQLYYVARLILGPVSKKTTEGFKVTPDQIVPDPTPDDYAAGKDPQLDAAITYLKGKMGTP